MKNLELLNELSAVAYGEEWNALLNMGKGSYTYFSDENIKNVITSLIKLAQNQELSKDKKVLFIDLYYSMIFNSYNMDSVITPYNIFEECVNNVFSLDIKSQEFEKKYSFLRLLVTLRDVKYYENFIIDHLKKYRNLELDNLESFEINHKAGRKKINLYKLFAELKKKDIDISFELILYYWILDKEKYDKELKNFLKTFDIKQVINNCLNDIDTKVFFDQDLIEDNIFIVSQYIDDKNFIAIILSKYLQGSSPLENKINTIITILKRYSNQSIQKIIDEFIKNIPAEYNDVIKIYSYEEKNNKKVLNIEIYRTRLDLEWKRNKYSHQVVSYTDDLKKHPKYEKDFPYYVSTEGWGDNLTYYAKGMDKYIPASPHFTEIESAIYDKAEQDLLSLGLYDSFEVVLPN